MTNKVKTWLPRVLGSLLLAAGALYFFYVLPSQAESIDTEIEHINATFQAITSADKALSDLESPDIIKVQETDSVRNYIQDLKAAAPNVSMPDGTRPGLVRGFFLSERTKTYNFVVTKNEFKDSYQTARQTLEQSSQFLDYHIAVMQALTNFLEYLPEQDTSSQDTDILLNAILLAGGGIEKTTSRLNQAGDYPDETRRSIKDSLDSFEKSRLNYQRSLESGENSQALREAYISECTKSQHAILRTRETFWQSNIGDRISELSNARQQLGQFQAQLSSL